VKAIIALRSYAYLAEKMGELALAKEYSALAQDYVIKWMQMADDDGHYRLAFDKPGTWSQKYNLVWDKLLGFNIFPETVINQELIYYLQKQNRFGLPLDIRESYGKSDWMVWTAGIARDEATFQKLLHPVWAYINETPDRIPLSDWHQTMTGKSAGFRARSVVGGFFIKVLEERLKPAN
jgi:hypothetical protein